ncbi:hypothetical protein GIB67_027874 [Kingdonia uniflora]|uniref:DUF1005 family protein n=1 Tax=Kingdonia uniflora TaxID=39325 RepID=A0A7J7LGB6_9MAGN|nr:hypothetical protein GIB67_027874 [Kingdonia uniflora]
MDPCPFVRLIIESLYLKLQISTKPAGSGTVPVHPSTTPCFCKLTLGNNNYFAPTQTTLLPLSNDNDNDNDDSSPDFVTSSAGFHLDQTTLRRFGTKPTTLQVSVYTGRMGRNCGFKSRKLLGRVRVRVRVDLDGIEKSGCLYQNGWMKLGSDNKPCGAKIHMVVRAEPDPRFVFKFGGEPECSPVVFQKQGNITQPVFSCKFSADRNSRTRSVQVDPSSNARGWLNTFAGDRERSGRERKGWMITIHDLSGSPVAAASMITPFVPSPNSDRVSRSNPGAWLILQPHGFSVSSWKPWGKLEAWRERGPIDGLGYKFELVSDTAPNRVIPIAEATMGMKKGGQFIIDASFVGETTANSRCPNRGFVMASTVEGEGKISKPEVQVGVQHVKCMADAALFIALSAAIDLSMDACRLFSHKLRKEFSHDQQDYIS